MQSKFLSKRKQLIIAFLGLIFSVVGFMYFTSENSIQDSSASLMESSANLQSEEQTNINSDLPTRLKIPQLNVDAGFEYVGLTSDGAMDIPKGPDEVAWFNLAARPGEIGSAVVAGHYGWKNDTPAVFDDLGKLRKGDKVSVEDGRGEIVTFVVRKTKIYGKDDIVPEVFSSSDGKAHLNLVTCTGPWNDADETYDKRLVVFTDRI